MQITREMRIGAGLLAFAGVLAWMIPPTRPVTPTVGTRPKDQGGASIAADAANAGKYVPPPGAVAAPPPQVAERDMEPVGPAEDPAPAPRVVVRQAPPVPAWRDAAPRFAEDAAEDEDRPSPRDPGYMLGYRWAQSNAIERRRDCRIWRGSPAEDGCRAYVGEADEAGYRDGPPWQQ